MTGWDESYCFGPSKPTPDLVLEVIFTSGSIGQLDLYQTLHIPEVWFWQDGVFSLYRLREAGYEPIRQSEIPELATLDMELLTRCLLIAPTSRLEAANTLRQALNPPANYELVKFYRWGGTADPSLPDL